MNMDSVIFVGGFLPVLLGLYWLIPSTRAKNILLLIAGFVFYAFGSLSGMVLLLIDGVLNYILGLFAAKKWVMVLGVVANLGFLCAYKYLDFFLCDLLGQQLSLGLIPPLGISFFTFKAIAYLIDTYRTPEQGTRSWVDYLLYLTFFPQISAGPISRFSDFGPQLQERELSVSNAAAGLRRFVVGLAKKVILAGTLAAAVDKVFGAEGIDIRLAWVGAVGYCLQIYFDFSGYSDMAIGLGQIFGFTTKENFEHPYIASTIGDFWRRWHISLASWFKDYLYIPLGGNRRGKLRAGINKLMVFALCGLWHGAAYPFLVWGLWHGLLSALESWNVIPAKRLAKTKVLGHIYTLLAVCLGFVMFRAETLAQGFEMIGAMFAGFQFTSAGTVMLHSILSGEMLAGFAVSILLCLPWKQLLPRREKLYSVLDKLSYPATLALFVLCLMALAAGGFAPFIYAQF